MSSYFDSTDEADLAYLPERFRDTEELATIATQAEADCIRAYLFSPPGSLYTAREGWVSDAVLFDSDLNLYVWLRGYQIDAADPDTNVNFKQALKETIADVVTWRLRTWHRDPTIASESVERGKSKTFRPEAREPFPMHWDYRLQIYDTREVTWGL